MEQKRQFLKFRLRIISRVKILAQKKDNSCKQHCKQQINYSAYYNVINSRKEEVWLTELRYNILLLAREKKYKNDEQIIETIISRMKISRFLAKKQLNYLKQNGFDILTLKAKAVDKIFRLLANQKKPLSASEIRKIIKLPYQTIYQGALQLVKKGKATRINGKFCILLEK